LLLVVVFCIVGLHSCELFKDFNDDCDATKMIEVREPVIYLRTVIPTGSMATDTDINYKLPDAEHIQISGSIQKIYCDGKKSGYFTFSHNLYPGDYPLPDLENGLFLSQPYQYKFQNDLDKLLVIVTFKAWFHDGKIYESHTFPSDFFYKDIRYEVNQTKYFLLIDDLNSGTQWRKVTS